MIEVIYLMVIRIKVSVVEDVLGVSDNGGNAVDIVSVDGNYNGVLSYGNIGRNHLVISRGLVGGGCVGGGGV